MKKSFRFAPVAAVAAAFSLSACGDEVTEVHQDGMAVLLAGEELDSDACDENHAGDMVYVTDSIAAFVCDGESWQTMKGADGKDVGTIMNGASCSAKSVQNKDKTLDGIEVSCGCAVVDTVWNGAKGETGATGKSAYELADTELSLEDWLASLKGEPGDSGETGAGCTLDDDGKGSVTVTCGVGDYAKTAILYKAVCGTEPYDPAKKFCSEGELYDLCGVETYDPKAQYCLELGDGESKTFKVEALLMDTRETSARVYKTVTIGTQVWMAENLNDSVNPGTQSWCGGGEANTKNEGDCSKYGRLYTWAAAIDSVALANEGQTCGYGETCNRLKDEELAKKPIQGVCPSGWHLPSREEWSALITAAGGDLIAGEKLKSKDDWNFSSDENEGVDAYSFSALPAGIRNGDAFDYAGLRAYFWSASMESFCYAYGVHLDYDGMYANLKYKNDKYNAFSVRCLRG